MPGPWKNQLYFGDNLSILREEVPDASVDLVYLDPPFNSNATYNVLFAEQSGERSAAQIAVFEDTWHWGPEPEQTYHEMITQGPRKGTELLQAFRSFLGMNDMMAYLSMMAIRLVELHRVLKPTGSIYLHCDPTASHYLKLLMDAVFSPKNFRNEIIWKRTSSHSDARQGARHYGRITDTLLFYAKDTQNTWNPQHMPYDPGYVERDYRRVDPDGRRYRIDNLQGPGGAAKGNPYYEVMGVSRHWRYSKEKMEELIRQGRVIQTRPGAVPQYKRYLDEMPGVPVQNLWADLPLLNNRSREVLGYPTQKPESLLERIIKTSSNEGDIVLDPFCGCGTAVAVSERLHRRWIGIDVTHLAIALMKHRLHDTFGPDLAPYEVIGVPEDLASAEALAQQNRYQFEWWALGLVDARPAQDKKKGADRGVDGHIYFFDDNSGKAKQIIAQVKSGNVSVPQVRDLVGVLQREKAAIGLFLTLREPTRPMLQEAAGAGFYVPAYFPDQRFPRLQVLTIAELLQGKQAQYPRYAPTATFRQASRRQQDADRQQSLL